MKVVLFCGGLGLRMREESTRLPKPMIPLGDRPILWHIMKYYSEFGFRDFILCLGYKHEVIKEYFLNYNEALSNDFVLSGGGQVELLRSDIADWHITFDQAKKFMTSLLHDPSRSAMIKDAMKQMLAAVKN